MNNNRSEIRNEEAGGGIVLFAHSIRVERNIIGVALVHWHALTKQGQLLMLKAKIHMPASLESL